MQICPKKPVRSALLVLAMLAALPLAACGSDDGGGRGDSSDLGADPATLAPANALVYLEATLRPEGQQKDDLLAALGKLLNEDDPGAKIRAQVEEAAGDEGYSFSEDFEPWLGSRSGFFLTEVSENDGEGAAVVAVTDRDAAERTVEKLIADSSERPEETSYEGTDYTIVGDGSVGFVGDFLVAGTEAGLKAAVDTSGGGAALSADADAAATLDELPAGSILEGYVDAGALLDTLIDAGAISEKDLEAAGGPSLDQYREAPVVFAAGASADSFFIEGSAAAGEVEQGPSVADLPSQSWLAFAIPMIGDVISSTYDSFLQGVDSGFRESFGSAAGLEGIPSGSEGFAPQIPDIRGEIEAATGLDLSEDLDWAGTLSLFAQGTSIFNLGGGILIESNDDDAALEAVEKLRKALEKSGSVQVTPTADGFAIAIPGAPVPAEVAVRDGNVVLAVAGVSVDAILNPTEPLASAPNFSAAASDLGDGVAPYFYLDLPTIVELVESTGQANGDPSYERAKPYLQAISYLIGGSGIEGDRSVVRILLGVQEAESSSSSGEAAALIP